MPGDEQAEPGNPLLEAEADGGCQRAVEDGDGAIGRRRCENGSEFRDAAAQGAFVARVVGEFGRESAYGDRGGVENGRVVIGHRIRAGERVATGGVFPPRCGGVEGKPEQADEGGVAVHQQPRRVSKLAAEAAGQPAEGPAPGGERFAGAGGAGSGDESEHPGVMSITRKTRGTG